MADNKTESKSELEEEEFYAQIATARNTNFQLGISSGLEQAGRFLLDESGLLFKNGKDELAKALRDYGRKLFTRSDNARKSYDQMIKEYRTENPEWDWL